MTDQTDQRPALPRRQTARALRVFYRTSVCWGMWGKLLATGSPVFVAYALHRGLAKEDMGLLMFVGMLMGLSQIVTAGVAQRVRNKKLFVLSAGMVEMLFPALLVLLIFLPRLRRASVLTVFLVLVAVGALGAAFASPIFSHWFSALIPERIRGRYMSRRALLGLVVSIVTGVGATMLLKVAKDSSLLDAAFFGLLVLGFLAGVAGYLFVMFLPKPIVRKQPAVPIRDIIRLPFRCTDFGRFVLFSGLWQAVFMISSAYYSTFMLTDLKMEYDHVGLVDGLGMVALGVGYLVWGVLVDRFGSKPMIKLVALLNICTPILYMINSPGHTGFVYLGAMSAALVASGGMLACTVLLFKTLPQGEDTAPYFGAYAALTCVASALGILAARVLLGVLKGTEWHLLGMSMNNFRSLFLVAAALGALPVLMLPLVREKGAASTGEFVSQLFRGNLLRYSFNYMIYLYSENPRHRSQAALAMGRSRSPMALGTLTAALEDPHPDVRSSAAYALGESRLPDAVHPLISKLQDGESDVRPQAAEALGKIRHGLGMGPLFGALDASDSRVRCSAMRALADIGGEEVRERLRKELEKPFDRDVFPSLLEALSHLGDIAVVRPAIESLGRFQRQVMRLQVLNCICRALGGANRFYRLVTAEELRRSSRVRRILESLVRSIAELKPRAYHRGRQEIAAALQEAVRAYGDEEFDAASESIARCAETLNECGQAAPGRAGEVDTCYDVIGSVVAPEIPWPAGEIRTVFLAVVLELMTSRVERMAGPADGLAGG